MDFPRPMKIGVYGFVFAVLLFGLASRINWFGLVVLAIILYALFRFMAMGCHHRYTALPMAAVLGFIAAFGLINIQTMTLLGLAMVADIII